MYTDRGDRVNSNGIGRIGSASESSEWDGELTFGPVGLEPFITTYMFLTPKYRLRSQTRVGGNENSQ